MLNNTKVMQPNFIHTLPTVTKVSGTKVMQKLVRRSLREFSWLALQGWVVFRKTQLNPTKINRPDAGFSHFPLLYQSEM